MKERPILFSAPMVRAILEGRKTVTRRVIKPVQPRENGMWPAGRDPVSDCPYGQPGDRLWVRETYALRSYGGAVTDTIHYAATPEHGRFLQRDMRTFSDSAVPTLEGRWRPSIHMPRWASRITLEVTGVRVERLQDITTDQILAEGVQIPTTPEGSALIDISTKHGPAFFLPALNGNSTDDLLRAHWAALWVAINGIDSWNANPWVWVVEFKRIQQAYTEATAA